MLLRLPVVLLLALLGGLTACSPDDGPDLGGTHFVLLRRPRVAIVTNSAISPSDYGHVWFHIDQHLRIPVTLLDAHGLAGEDLRRYNVVLVPPAGL